MLYLVPDVAIIAQAGDPAPVPTFTTLATMIGLVLTVLIPIVNGLVTRWEESRKRAWLQIVLQTATGFLTEWLDSLSGLGSGDAFNLTEAVIRSVVAIVTAIAVTEGVFKPIGVTAWAKSRGVGAGETRLRDVA